MTSISAIAQIAILYFIIYAILKRARGSRFGQALAGVGMLAAAMFAFAYLFHFDVLTRSVQFLLLYLAVSTVVIFQPEIRRALMTFGALGFVPKTNRHANGAATPEIVVDTLLDLSKDRMGALIAFERGISLRSYEDTGVATDALFTRELVRSIFTPPLPLHDGGMVLRDGFLASAHCIFPVSNNPDLIASGMRHRAAVGLSEETDALVAVVSEERGTISIAHNGHLYSYEPDSARDPLLRWLTKAMPQGPERRGFIPSVLVPIQQFFLRQRRTGK